MNGSERMPEHTTEIEALRQEYNAAVANGMLLFARQIERHMSALERRVIPPGSDPAS